MIVGGDGQRLSKRHGAVSVLQYRDEGFLPEAMQNYLVRRGWSSGDQEIFSLDEMISSFDFRLLIVLHRLLISINSNGSISTTSKHLIQLGFGVFAFRSTQGSWYRCFQRATGG
ncbi:MAG: hypothetical protein Ct9H300mP14_06780 [Gammaproteobacteria bacterium]|nr:MAG: hypothetical protein Ct9H300mP14_06780 [Gammaproteobacteria bacterium]